jgi:hypothetical protein
VSGLGQPMRMLGALGEVKAPRMVINVSTDPTKPMPPPLKPQMAPAQIFGSMGMQPKIEGSMSGQIIPGMAGLGTGQQILPQLRRNANPFAQGAL